MSSFTVSYSPEDNKIRLYVGRVPREEYELLRAAGFISTPKQDCDFVATWTPDREDLARDYLEEGEDIGDEDYSPLERSADRAERFGDYRDKRAGEAGASADTFASGPSAFGHQNARRAERQATRHDRHRTRACSQWSKAEYWQSRTEGVIQHALHKSSARVRRGRILELEAEQRKLLKSLEEHAERYRKWETVMTLDGLDDAIKKHEDSQFIGISPDNPVGARAVYYLANSASHWSEYEHPRTGKKSSLYSLLTDPVDPITPREAIRFYLAEATVPGDPDSSSERWARHYELRLGYERAMLAEEGGTAADAEMEPGGWISGVRTSSCLTDCEGGWLQIQSVARSPATKKVTSVKVWGTSKGYTKESGYKEYGVKPALVTVNVQRLPEGAYRAPTPEEKEAFLASQKEEKKAAKATKPKEPSLINPTDEDAKKLQDEWNRQARELHARQHGSGECSVVEVRRMTQAEYSARSKANGPCQTSDISENLKVRRAYSVSDKEKSTVFKVRTSSVSGVSWFACRAVVILTDKPQKAIPWADVEAAKLDGPTEEKLFSRLGELRELIEKGWHPQMTDEDRLLLNQMSYLGWCDCASATQFHWTQNGLDALRRFESLPSLESIAAKESEEVAHVE